MTSPYRSTLEELFAKPRPSGYTEAELADAEQRLGLALPSALREHYRTFGRLPFNRAHDRLLEPSRLRVAEDMLIFYEENQQVFCWGMALAELDGVAAVEPRVFQSLAGEGEWSLDHDRLSRFFYTMLFHHRVRMPPYALGRAPRAALASLEPSRIALPGCARELATVHRRGNVVIEVDDYNEGELVRVLVGAPSEAELAAVQGSLPAEWL